MDHAAPAHTGIVEPTAARSEADLTALTYRAGLAAGLSTALTDLDSRRPPGGVAAIPTAQVAPTDSVIGHSLAEAEGISFVRGLPLMDEPALSAFAVRLGAVRVGVTQRLLTHAVTHLSGRTVGGEPTLRKQLVLGAIADVQTALEVARQTLRVAADLPAAVAQVHEDLTAIDWEAAKLLGGSGYVGSTPARTAYVSRLVANCWIKVTS